MCFESFLCWKLKTAIKATIFYTIFVGFFCAILELLDIIAFTSDGFDIRGGFKAQWRSHVWDGWLATNVVMMTCHLIMVGYSILCYFALQRFPTLYEYAIMRAYRWIFIAYILVELGIGCYRYSWYGPNTYRLGYLVFTFLFWVLRTLINITCVLIIWSHCNVLARTIDPAVVDTDWEELDKSRLIIGSGYTTPALSGYSTPRTAMYSTASQA